MLTAEPKARQTVRLAKGDRRAQLLRCAITVFSERGFRGTTTKQIAERADVSEAIIFRHFPTKEELYRAIIDQQMEESQRRVEAIVRESSETKEDQKLFERLAYEILEFYRKDPAFLRLLMYSGLEGHVLSELCFRTHVVKFYDLLGRYIRQRIADGAFRKVAPARAIRAFMGMVINQAMVKELYSNDLARLSSRQAARTFSGLFLEGIASRTRRKGRNSRLPRVTR